LKSFLERIGAIVGSEAPEPKFGRGAAVWVQITEGTRVVGVVTDMMIREGVLVYIVKTHRYVSVTAQEPYLKYLMD
jgi:hypothetical protein